jgi:hypothetical protein
MHSLRSYYFAKSLKKMLLHMLFLHTYICILDLISDSFLLLLQFKIAPWRNLINRRGMWGCLKEFACKDGCGGKQEREGMGLMGFSQSRCLQEPG